MRAACAAGLAATLAACQWLVPLDVEIVPPVAADDAGDAQAEADPPRPVDGGACGRLPAPPGAPTQQGAGAAYYFVLTAAELVADGFDLDCVDSRCEGSAAPRMACVPRGAGPYCDGDRGVDNGMLVARDRSGLSIDLDKYSDRMRAGTSALVLGVLGYDGTAEDSDVTFVMFPARADGAVNECPPDPSALDGGALPAVLLNGCDTFQGDNTHVALGTPLRTVHGYVTGGRLVVSEPHEEWIAYGTRYVEAQGEYLEASIRPANGATPMKLEATVGGRVTASAFLRVLGEQRMAPDPPLCLGTLWPDIRHRVCAELDMPRAGAPASEPCDALSYALKIEAVAVRLSTNTYAPDPVVSRCSADSGVPGSDDFTCD